MTGEIGIPPTLSATVIPDDVVPLVVAALARVMFPEEEDQTDWGRPDIHLRVSALWRYLSAREGVLQAEPVGRVSSVSRTRVPKLRC